MLKESAAWARDEAVINNAMAIAGANLMVVRLLLDRKAGSVIVMAPQRRVRARHRTNVKKGGLHWRAGRLWELRLAVWESCEGAEVDVRLAVLTGRMPVASRLSL